MREKVENVGWGCILKTQLKRSVLIVKRQETKEFFEECNLVRDKLWKNHVDSIVQDE